MISSMTAFGTGQSENNQLSLTIEIRSINSRFLDINIKLPEDLRYMEPQLREKINKNITRGKVELRLSYTKTFLENNQEINTDYLENLVQQLKQARILLPETPSPTLFEILEKANQSKDNDISPETWLELSLSACDKAIKQLLLSRQREGQRLGKFMLDQASEIIQIVDTAKADIPILNQEHQKKINTRIKDSLNAVCPTGFENITGAELSARIAQEASLFAMRGDIEEELTRIKSHVQELQNIIGLDPDSFNTTDVAQANPSDIKENESSTKNTATTSKPKSSKTSKSGKNTSAGKRIDFLCQELNREANTLGSKANGIEITNAAIDLKLLIEQLREQAQNIE